MQNTAKFEKAQNTSTQLLDTSMQFFDLVDAN